MNKTQKLILNLRKNICKLTKAEFAKGIKGKLRTLEEWESGRALPVGSVIDYFEHATRCELLQDDIIFRGKGS